MLSRYEMIRELGSGATGTVWLVYDHFIHRHVALKEMNGNKAEWVNLSLQNEFQILVRLEHAGIPRIMDCIRLQEKDYMVMEYVEGINLKELVESRGSLSEEQVLDIAIQLCEILKYLHTHKNKILYLDLKPQNVMLTENGTVKLIDFGSARELEIENQTEGKSEMRIGTYGYAAPELMQGKGEMLSEKTDIYSLGATLFYLLTGIDAAKPPYEIKPVREWNSMISLQTQKMISTCTQKKIDLRFQSVEEAMEKMKEDKKVFLRKNVKEYLIERFKRKPKFLLKQEKNIYCTEKKKVGFLRIIGCTACLFSLLAMESYAAREKLFVNIRNEINQKLLIQEGAVYYTRESILFEIPKQQMLQEEEYEFTIISRNLSSGQEKERKFLIVSQSNEEESECIENIQK